MMLYWVWLSRLKGVGPVTQKKLLEHFQAPQRIYEASAEELRSVSGVGKTISHGIKSASLDEAQRILEKADKKQISLLTYDNPLYPAKAKESPEAPILLYYKGNLREDSMGVGIVGARRCSEYGKHVAGEAATYLADNNITVISGLAKGIDGYAHTACLKANGYTLAFLGNGLDICYPKEHYRLLEMIIANGVVLSEYPPGVQPRPDHFPKRNELIAAWSEKLLIVEAGEKSGALITAKYAKELDREVLVAPSQIYSLTGKGTNQLIAEGDHIYLHPSQLNIRKGINTPNILAQLTKAKNEISVDKRDKRAYTTNEQKIIDLLQNNPMTLDQISAKINIEKLEMLEVVSMFELEGVIRVLPGGRRALTLQAGGMA